MNIVKLKGMVNDNPFTKFVAERILNGYTLIRKCITGSYTKNKEDLIVFEYLQKEYNIAPSKIRYADLGANDYRRGNNTYLFYTKGARGILVEANPLLCRTLGRKRKRDRVRNVAIGTSSAESIDFYVLSLPTRSSMNKESIDESLKRGLKLKETISIPCVNINDLFDRDKLFPDYMSIDIEGMDFQVLKTLDFDKYKIKVIVAESDDERDENGLSMNEFMKSKGYRIYKDLGSNTVYVLETKA